MKTYTTGQIIDLLKAEQIAICVEGRNKNRQIEKSQAGHIYWNDNFTYVQLKDSIAGAKWQLLPQYVTLDEAVKAYDEGKAIQSEVGRLFSNKTHTNPAFHLSEIKGKWSIVEEDSQ